YERNKRAVAKRQTSGGERTAPTQVERFDETDNHTSKSQGRQTRSGPIYASCSDAAAALRYPPKGNRYHKHRDWQIEEEHPPPGSVLNQPAPKYRPNGCSDRRETRPCTDGPTATFLVERLTDDRQTAGYKECSSYTLNAPCDDQLMNVGGDSASGGSQGQK